MENIHPNQSTIYDFLPKEECLYEFKYDSSIFCVNSECVFNGYVIEKSDCKECNLFESVEK